jgi:hypothetical protein
MAMLRLIYGSQPFGFDEATLRGILLDARRCNTRDGITGALVCRHDLYLQLLEGPEAMVEACLARIQADDRHLDLHMIARDKVQERMFPHWAMRDDPARSWMWSSEQVAAGVVKRATSAEALAIFGRLAGEAAAPA